MTKTDKSKCLLVSFNFSKKKDKYPELPYQIASIMAPFANSDLIAINYFDYDMNGLMTRTLREGKDDVIDRFVREYKGKIQDYSFVALSAYAWSEVLVKELLEVLRNKLGFTGKIILGGYEITAREEDELKMEYPGVDYYIQGYGEKAFGKIFRREELPEVVLEKVESVDLASPYLSGTLKLDTKRIYWETKRGCRLRCDFCEWGRAAKRNAKHGRIIKIDPERLKDEIELFRRKNIKAIKILDASFIDTEKDLEILERVLTSTGCDISFESHFTHVEKYLDKVIEVVKPYKDRVAFEFGLQTIEEKEMVHLQRENDLNKVERVMTELNQHNFKYEISIIYGIPEQTSETFKKTIDFIVKNGGTNFRAFNLRLPYKSDMKRDKGLTGLTEETSPDSPYIAQVNKTRFSLVQEYKKSPYEKEGKNFLDFLKDNGLDQGNILEELDAQNPYRDFDKMKRMAQIGCYGLSPSAGAKKGKKLATIIEDFNLYLTDPFYILADIRKKEFKQFVAKYLKDPKSVLAPYVDLVDLTAVAPCILHILNDQGVRNLSGQENNQERIAELLIDFIHETYNKVWDKLLVENPFEEEEFFLDEFIGRIEKVIQLRGPGKIDLVEAMLTRGGVVIPDSEFRQTYYLIKRFIEATYSKKDLSLDFYEKAKKFLEPLEEPMEFRETLRAFIDKWRRLLMEKKLDWVGKILQGRGEEFCRGLEAKLSPGRDEAGQA